MADYYFAKITIPFCFVEASSDLAIEISNYVQDIDFSWSEFLKDGEWSDAETTLIIDHSEHLLDQANKKLLILEDTNARWGEFGSIEAICKAQKIPFDRLTSKEVEMDYVEGFRPDMKEVKTCVVNESEDAMVPMMTLREIIKEQTEEKEALYKMMEFIMEEDYQSSANLIDKWC